jgi:predicted NUDIX family NTP pyrophosphohydrolase
MVVHSAGVLLYRFSGGQLEVMLVHPGGPFWKNKDDGAWSIPKGIFDENEDALSAAKREFEEETGFSVDGEFIYLGELRQPSKKIVHAWAIERDIDVTLINSNTFSVEWPKNSGILREYSEIDKGDWFDVETARRKILKGQAGFIDKLVEMLKHTNKESSVVS